MLEVCMADENLSLHHEVNFVRSFILPERRDRYLTKLGNIKTRSTFLNRLNHKFVDDLEKRYIVECPKLQKPPSTNLCYVMADEQLFDGKLVTPEIANEFLHSAYFGIVVSFIPGKLAAYKDESPSKIIWLERS
jgi:hypothetical protein